MKNNYEETILPGGIGILYEDAHILVCRKPSGIAVQSANLRVKDMESILKLYLLEKNPQTVPYLGVVHRLDQPVEGILVFGKTQKAAAALSAQAAGGKGGKRMSKQYLAVSECADIPPDEDVPSGQTKLTDWLLRDGRTNTSRIVPQRTRGAKESRLLYQTLEIRGLRRLLLVTLLTGRHHQIRVQLAGAGMPVVGDQKYHPAPTGESLALCAHGLSFYHPETGERMEFSVRPQGEAFEMFKNKIEKTVKWMNYLYKSYHL